MQVVIPGPCEYDVAWQGGIKVAVGIKAVDQLTLNKEIILGYLGESNPLKWKRGQDREEGQEVRAERDLKLLIC